MIEEYKETPREEIKRNLKGWGLVNCEGMFPEDQMEKEYDEMTEVMMKIMKKQIEVVRKEYDKK